MKNLRIILNLLFVIFISLIIYFLWKYKVYFIASPSMTPELLVNELVVIKKANTNEKYEVGDIITFWDDSIEATVTHRIVEITGEEIYTKGDNNNTRDLYSITRNEIIGKVAWSSYFLGCFLLNYKYTIVILLICFIVICNLLLDLFKEDKKYVKKG